MLSDLNPWSLIISLVMPLIIIAVIGFALVMVLRLGLGGRGTAVAGRTRN